MTIGSVRAERRVERMAAAVADLLEGREAASGHTVTQRDAGRPWLR